MSDSTDGSRGVTNSVDLLGDRRRGATGRLFVWLVFGVLIGLLPLMRPLSRDFLTDDGVSLDLVFGHGELFIVAAVIAAGAMGEISLAGLRLHDGLQPMVALGGCFICFVLNTAAYWSVGQDGGADPLSPHRISVISLLLFGLTLLASGPCIWIAAVRNGS